MNTEHFTVSINDESFAYDVRSLLRAFFEQCEVDFVPVSDGGNPDIQDKSIDLVINISDGVITQCYHGVTKTVPANGERSEVKNSLKLLLYDTLSEETGRVLPWGGLTGIRPVKLVMKQLEKGLSESQIHEFTASQYRVSPARSKLAYDIACREKVLLSDVNEDSYCLYIGIPFCPSICLYCSFSSYPIAAYKNKTDKYLSALYKELSATAKMFEGRTLDSIYIGGGTPTSLSAEQIFHLLNHVKNTFDLSKLREWTIEAGRPDSLTPEKLKRIRCVGDLRISINPQTFWQKTLDIIGRAHTTDDVISAYNMAREFDFSCINMDLIVGLPGEREAEVSYTLNKVLELAPDNLTVHSLALKRASRLSETLKSYSGDSFFQSEAIMELVHGAANSLDMKPYYLYRQKDIAGNLENIGFAPYGKEGIYNILIMEEVVDIAACGAGGVSKRIYNSNKPQRAANIKDVDQYISRIDEMIDRKRRLYLA